MIMFSKFFGRGNIFQEIVNEVQCPEDLNINHVFKFGELYLLANPESSRRHSNQNVARWLMDVGAPKENQKVPDSRACWHLLRGSLSGLRQPDGTFTSPGVLQRNIVRLHDQAFHKNTLLHSYGMDGSTPARPLSDIQKEMGKAIDGYYDREATAAARQNMYAMQPMGPSSS